MLWGVIAVWLMCCAASLSLPWPATVLVVLLCGVLFFELASPTGWAGANRRAGCLLKTSGSATGSGLLAPPGKTGVAAAGVGVPMLHRRSPAAVVTCAVHALISRLRGGTESGDDMKELAGNAGSAGEKALTWKNALLLSGLNKGEQRLALQRAMESDSLAELLSHSLPQLPPPLSCVLEIFVSRKELCLYKMVWGSDDNGLRIVTTSQQPGATFIKGTVGSFSRGGLMVTYDGRVIYKVNQDRGLISHPSLNAARHTIFGVFDGHGENGEHVAAYAMREVPRRMALHGDAIHDPASALEDVFLEINSSLPDAGINALFGGCTAVVALVRGSKMWVANAGDSRALVAGRAEDGAILARGLTQDQNPDCPGERDRIESMGGFVSDPEEVGASARVWLDETRTMVGLAMSRSIGDLAVKRVGVIALPEVTEYEIKPTDEFLILASDGVWEFIDNQEAAEVVHGLLEKGEDAAGACKGLMELANRRWSDMVGDYRDDITATVVLIPFLPPPAAAVAAAINASADAAAAAEEAGDGRSSALASAASAAFDPAAEAMGEEDTGQPAEAGSAQETRDASVPAQGAMSAAIAAAQVTNVRGGSDGEAMPAGDSRRFNDAGLTGGSGEGLASTPAVTPGDKSVDKGDRKGGGGLSDAEINSAAETTRLLSAISAALTSDDGAAAATAATAVAAAAAASVSPREDDDDVHEELCLSGGVVAPLAEPSRAPASSENVVSTAIVDSYGEGVKREEGEEGGDSEEWDWEFGAREHREPSREMREASREFLPGSLDTLAVGRDALET